MGFYELFEKIHMRQSLKGVLSELFLAKKCLSLEAGKLEANGEFSNMYFIFRYDVLYSLHPWNF